MSWVVLGLSLMLGVVYLINAVKTNNTSGWGILGLWVSIAGIILWRFVLVGFE